ncbi:putative mitochondrial protein [Cucumis melo var. makuwa]|uniref:Mitochondrial protein n=1 Tax=Cucumis melo var. makuwa TaxID=1194695 RepID=A0A5D3E6Q8_CUCMM|nr:putative mitochondrial protein [Cucumis melo var. makuwa]TYK31612.1 putative mitochondrial protein [Cucumis melo var. makuwa]
MTSVRSLLAIAATKQWPLLQMDVKNVFLSGTISEEVYMKPPPGFRHLSYFLGLEIILEISSSDLLTRSNITDSATFSMPLDPNMRLTPSCGVPLDDLTFYRQLVGTLIYLTVIHPDMRIQFTLIVNSLLFPV